MSPKIIGARLTVKNLPEILRLRFPVKPRGQFQIHTGLNDGLPRVTLCSMQDMKMLFSSRNRTQIEQVREQLVAAGIRC